MPQDHRLIDDITSGALLIHRSEITGPELQLWTLHLSSCWSKSTPTPTLDTTWPSLSVMECLSNVSDDAQTSRTPFKSEVLLLHMKTIRLICWPPLPPAGSISHPHSTWVYEATSSPHDDKQEVVCKQPSAEHLRQLCQLKLWFIFKRCNI